jgi:hypothetical protein
MARYIVTFGQLRHDGHHGIRAASYKVWPLALVEQTLNQVGYITPVTAGAILRRQE